LVDLKLLFYNISFSDKIQIFGHQKTGIMPVFAE